VPSGARGGGTRGLGELVEKTVQLSEVGVQDVEVGTVHQGWRC
jgi:hypothetical protein